MNTLRILILTALAVFLVGGFLTQHESDTSTSDMLFTLLVVGYLWYVMHRKKQDTPPDPSAQPAPNPPQTQPTQPTLESEPAAPLLITPATAPLPRMFFASRMMRPTGRIIQHKLPWSVVEQGKSVGQFRHVPIPAWIRTSDNRHADYAGIAQTALPDGCVCLELPEQAELILPPGLVYAIRS
ncbi:MAG: hypothetical protein G8237_13395 [Magnetococcales bacterium]|nr:hypothetical protein [Magnetococcales bacterium]